AASETEEWGPADGIERSAFTLLADVLTSIGLAFILAGAIALSGREVDWRHGMIWGLCGFAAFFASPSLGLAPELPGMQAAELAARQIWWISTVILTAGGLAMLFLAGGREIKAVGIMLIVAPHFIADPAHEVHPGGVPAELAAEFVVATLVISGLFWLLLGGLTGHFYRRFAS
ncbi:MAG: CbtA family protein, partial [Alphaproteobacteria bacterium]